MPTPELIEVAQMLSELLSQRTGALDIPAKAYLRLPREQLFERIEAMDRALQPFRPINPRQIGPTPTAAPPAGPVADLLDGIAPPAGEGGQAGLALDRRID